MTRWSARVEEGFTHVRARARQGVRHRRDAVKSGRGLFADALVTRFSLLPVEEEGRLNDPRLRENFIERIFAYRRLRALFAQRWSMGTVVRFHTAHKLTLMAHMPEAYSVSAAWWHRASQCRGENSKIAIRPNS
jgi:hypothetical protein